MLHALVHYMHKGTGMPQCLETRDSRKFPNCNRMQESRRDGGNGHAFTLAASQRRGRPKNGVSGIAAWPAQDSMMQKFEIITSDGITMLYDGYRRSRPNRAWRVSIANNEIQQLRRELNGTLTAMLLACSDETGYSNATSTGVRWAVEHLNSESSYIQPFGAWNFNCHRQHRAAAPCKGDSF